MSNLDFTDFLTALDDDPFEQYPVDVATFVTGAEYLHQPPLSEIQYTLVECMSQIYREEDLRRFMPGTVQAYEHHRKFTKNEVIMQLGKGSGKDHTSTIGVAYLVYKLMCLKDPAGYFGKPPGDAIDIINIAINAQQARNVFFKGFRTKIERSPWFAGKFNTKVDSIEFDKTITVYSGHSERESHEGLNLICAVLDEISGFALESNTGNEMGKTAAAIYKAFRGTIDSRFPDVGKCILLSFPRFKGDYIQQRYNDAIAEKDTIVRSHTFVINDELPADDPNNQFEIEWEEDHILHYKFPKIFALKRPTWEVNPTRHLEDFKMAFYTDPADAMMRFACMPTDVNEDSFFRQHEKIESMMRLRNPVNTNRVFDASFKPDPDVQYFVHADLAQKSDKCAVAIAHVDKWVYSDLVKNYDQFLPFVVVDAIAWWEPKREGNVDLSEVRKWIQNLRNMGFRLGMVTFDRWNSVDIQKALNEVGIKTEVLSVAKKHYEDVAMLIYEERIVTPYIELLKDELFSLRVNNTGTKVDHPRKKSKDLADAMVGAVFNAISLTVRETNRTVSVHTWARPERNELPKDTIKPPKMPDEVRQYLLDFRLI